MSGRRLFSSSEEIKFFSAVEGIREYSVSIFPKYSATFPRDLILREVKFHREVKKRAITKFDG